METLIHPQVRDALVQAVQMRLFELLFDRPTPSRNDEISTLASELGDDALAKAALAAAVIDDPTHVALFGPGGPVSPRQAAYCGRQDPGAVMADISAFYRAFAYVPSTEEPADHVAIESGYSGYLWLKEAYPRTNADVAEAQLVR